MLATPWRSTPPHRQLHKPRSPSRSRAIRRQRNRQHRVHRFGHGDNDVVIMIPAMLTIDGLTEEPHVLSALHTLAVDARVTCFDRRGIGLADPLSADGDPFDDWVADLAAVLDAVGAERPTILANFDTGLVAIEFAARYPDRVGSLILVHCFARFARGDDYPFGIDLATADALVDDSVDTRPTGRASTRSPSSPRRSPTTPSFALGGI